MFQRMLLCLPLVLATAVSAAAEHEDGRQHGLFSTSTPRDVVRRPPQSIRGVTPHRRSGAARPGPAAPVMPAATGPASAAGPVSFPNFPPAQTLELAPDIPAWDLRLKSPDEK